MPFAVKLVLTNGRWLLSTFMCRLWVSVDVVGSTASIVTLCIISWQRLHAVTHPLSCATYKPRGMIWIGIIGIWLYSTCVLLITIKWKNFPDAAAKQFCFVGDQLEHLLVSVILSFYAPLFLLIIVSCRITKVINKRGHGLVFGSSMDSNSQTFALRVHRGKGNGLSAKQKFLIKQQHKTYRTLAYVMVIFIFCWLPFFITYPLRHFFPHLIHSSYVEVFMWLGYSNSICNVVIYAVKMKDFSRGCRKVYQAVFCVRRYEI
ncbi:hypothetical protein M514_03596 [Trichuris suis]|uniref:G-protein coupled receptors family 1 profile domain-containing protein n=1 Tax=Trichuris suis TaxID=68888 RepID=A0A085ME98_9BILA|nr:hypothetical protein M513_03596 [Trichuris suis]KFD62972.1 hypothetical protein M514_03596 [Trichuris suis]